MRLRVESGRAERPQGARSSPWLEHGYPYRRRSYGNFREAGLGEQLEEVCDAPALTAPLAEREEGSGLPERCGHFYGGRRRWHSGKQGA
jgi:hypothetical protein